MAKSLGSASYLTERLASCPKPLSKRRRVISIPTLNIPFGLKALESSKLCPVHTYTRFYVARESTEPESNVRLQGGH